ncbi:MAG: cell division FtsA domain-containing protein [Methylocystaceae bacterium]
MQGERIYALDIGTRTVVGVLLEKGEDGFQIIEAEMREHQTRAMVDGQIHDVEAVARVINTVTTTIEERCGYQLKEAAVAAAGRALKTSLGRYEAVRDSLAEITAEECLAWELAAVQEAQQQVGENNRPGPALFCVGYSVIHYYLEEQPIASLIGQTGNLAAVEVVATFLPRVVVDSLFASLRRCGLAVKSLTLEPIAALSVAIPENMRLLNLALVDVGAGTSDIALVRRGSTYGYAMVPLGGDEVTEAIIEYFLVDFDTAEYLKRNYQEAGICFQDILGNEHALRPDDLLECLRPVVARQAASIAHEIMELNGKVPDALVFVGGGSLTPLLLDQVAAEMGLARSRVGIRDRNNISNIIGGHEALVGPQAVTPLGIGYNALTSPGLPFIRIKVNGREFPLWNVGGVTVASALLGAGISLQSMNGRPGMGITVEIDHIIKAVRGGRGKSPVIAVNGQEATLDTPIKDLDKITFEPGHPGEDAHPTVKDLVNVDPWILMVNGEPVRFYPPIMVNGQLASPEDIVADHDRITTNLDLTVSEVLISMGVKEAARPEEIISYSLNGEQRTCMWGALEIKVNDQPGSILTAVKSDDHISYRLSDRQIKIADIIPSGEQLMTIKLNGEEKTVNARVDVYCNEELVAADSLLQGGMQLTSTRPTCLVSDLLNYVELKPSLSGRLRLMVNNDKVGFTREVNPGDEVEISWE